MTVTETEILDGMQFSFLNGKDPMNTTGAPALTITYQYAGTSAPADLPTSSTYTGWTAFTAAEKAAIRDAMDHIETFLNVSFVEVTGDSDPDMNIGNVDLPGSTAGTGGYSASSIGNTISRYDSYVVYDNTLALEGEMSLLLHELGHAMGLKHPFSSPTVPSGYDSNKYSLMSYTANPDNGVDSDAMMLFDVFALQDMWGAASYNTGNTSYTAPRNSTVDLIWDTGGTDELNASAKTTKVILDLREGEFSQFGTYDDVVIGYGVTIENAKGGSKGDKITGNDVRNVLTGNGGYDTILGNNGNDVLNGNKGNDRMFGGLGKDNLLGGKGADNLFGNKGNDTIKGGQGADKIRGEKGTDQLYGNGGADTFIYKAGYHKDVIHDFADDVDTLQVSGHGTLADVLGDAKEQNGNVIFDFGGGDIINVKNITIAEIIDDLVIV
jgi:serralysin